jgi:hypothetical protein
MSRRRKKRAGRKRANRQRSIDDEALLRRDLLRRPPRKSRRGQTVEQAAEEIQRELLENFRRNMLQPGERDYLATQLEAYWFPKSKAVKEGRANAKKIVRLMKAELYQREIKRIAAAKNIAENDEAKVHLVEDWQRRWVELFNEGKSPKHIVSVEALNELIKRVKRENKV